MSVSTPIFTTPSETLSAASPLPANASSAPIAMVRIARVMPAFPFRFRAATWDRSDTEELLQRLLLAFELLLLQPVDDAPALDEVVAVGERRDEPEVLLHEDHGEAALLEIADDAPEHLHDDGREPLGDLVEQEEPRPDAQDAGDRQHLLLAAGAAAAL